jgi:flagellar protein FlgJ
MKIISMLILTLSISTVANANNFERFNKKAMPKQDSDRLQKEAVELEAVLLSKMIDPMFPDGKESGLYGGGHGSDIYRQMVIDQYARTMAENGGIGLSGSIKKDLENK